MTLESAWQTHLKNNVPDARELRAYELDRLRGYFADGFIAGQKAMRVELPEGFFKASKNFVDQSAKHS